MVLEIAIGLLYIIAAWFLMNQPRVFVVRAHRKSFPRSLGAMMVAIGVNVPCDFHQVIWELARTSSEAGPLRFLLEQNIQLVLISMIGIGSLAWWVVTQWWGLRSWVRIGLGTAFAVECCRAGLLVAGDASEVAASLALAELLGLWMAVCTGPMRHHRAAVTA